MEVILQEKPQSACLVVAQLMAHVIRSKPNAVLGLATGTTPLPVYQELIRLHRDEQLDFSGVTTFNLDEYVGLSPKHPQSYHAYMYQTFFNHVNMDTSRIHIPNGMAANIPEHCLEYEKSIRDAGGLDMQLLGLGHDGHIGFNEPTSSFASRTRIKTLTKQTRLANARFFAREADVPHHVITMGIGTIMEAKCCVVLAYGSRKADAVARMVEGPVTSMCPASALQWHPQTKVCIDQAAAEKLTLRSYYQWVYQNKPDWQRF